MIERSQHADGFTVITNEIINRFDMSDEAFRLLVFMLSCADGWSFSVEGLAYRLNWSPRKVAKYVTELKRFGYIEQARRVDAHGRFLPSEWVVHEEPVTALHKNRRAVKPHDGKTAERTDRSAESPQSGKSAPLTNTNNKQIPNRNKEQIETKNKGSALSKPSLEEIAEYCKERGNKVDPQAFIDHYEANGWKVGRNPMKDWRATVRNWERNDYGTPKRSHRTKWKTGAELGLVSTEENRAPVSKITTGEKIPNDILEMFGD